MRGDVAAQWPDRAAIQAPRETSATDSSSLATKSFGSSPSFVYPDPGPLLENQGLTALKFAAPVYPGEKIAVTLT